MVDFKKKLGIEKVDKKINPVEIYDQLDRKSLAGPLRDVQKIILNSWFKNHGKDRDLIIKLHTGEGKTLIGLLILQSKLNQGEGPGVYICPNIYLYEQTCTEAKKFGINFVTISSENNLPSEFLAGEKILITYVQKVFHGRTIFGLDTKATKINNIILDDAHACVDSIRQSFTIKIDSERISYKKLISLFEEELRGQGEGSFLEIQSGEYGTILRIPYWAWVDKKTEVLKILAEENNEEFLKYSWPLIKDNLHACDAFVSGQAIEITLTHIPIKRFGSFHNAKTRILMSATTQDDTFFIKGFEFNIEAIKNPLSQTNMKWSGEKMLLIPSLIDFNLDRDMILTHIAKRDSKRQYGVVVIAPSFKGKKSYENFGFKVAEKKNITNFINILKNEGYTDCVVIVNRYDGIDLPDDSCRVLILDGKPVFDSLADRYEELCRENSDITNIKIAQKIEQGLGRSVRGEKDYSVIILLDPELIAFLKSPKTRNYFSPQTRAQIDIGIQITNFAKEEKTEGDPALPILNSLISQSIQRDDGWKEFYKEEMEKITVNSETVIDYKLIENEKIADEFYYNLNFEKAVEIMQGILDQFQMSDAERGWYLQKLAKFNYSLSKSESNRQQLAAFNLNYLLLKPISGINYNKLSFINEIRTNRILEWIKKYKDFEELSFAIEGILSNFSFGVEAEKFEKAVQDIGLFLGFLSQRPDKEIKKGPDNLWCGVGDNFVILECKSEVEDDRKEINKSEAGQMNTHCGWFEEVYGKEVSVLRILIIPTKNLSYYANFTHDVRIMRKGKLRDFKANLRGYLKELKKYDLNSISAEKIDEFLRLHKLNIENLSNDYTEKYTQQKK